ncbi:UNVERIFIED_CONTAM: hypothetical protein Sindi_0992600 [Sesamum indicum]
MDSPNSPLTHTPTPPNTHIRNNGQHGGKDGFAVAEEADNKAVAIDNHGEGVLLINDGAGNSIIAQIRTEVIGDGDRESKAALATLMQKFVHVPMSETAGSGTEIGTKADTGGELAEQQVRLLVWNGRNRPHSPCEMDAPAERGALPSPDSWSARVEGIPSARMVGPNILDGRTTWGPTTEPVPMHGSPTGVFIGNIPHFFCYD